MTKDIVPIEQSWKELFDSIKRVNPQGVEYWLGRELMTTLDYNKWEHFNKNIKRGSQACKNVGNAVSEHFFPTSGNINGPGRSSSDWMLTRYACYLTSMNCDPDKPVVAAAQSYFAARTFEAEVRAEAISQPKTALELAEETLRLATVQVQLQKELELQKAINQSLEEDNERQAEIIDELHDYSSIIRIAKFNGCSEKAFSWRVLKAASKTLNKEIKTAPCPRFEKKNLYSHDAWRLAYPDYKLPETLTLTVVNNSGDLLIGG